MSMINYKAKHFNYKSDNGIAVISIKGAKQKNPLTFDSYAELRDVFSIEPKLRKARFARNPKTNEKIYVKEKYYLLFKSSKMWSNKINEEK